MTDLPDYYAWYPCVEHGGDVVSIVLTRGTYERVPESGDSFAAALLSACGVEVPLVGWGTDEFVTQYFAGSVQGTASWEECWNVRLLLASKIGKRRPRQFAGAPITAAPATVAQIRSHVPVRIIADFDSRAAATACRDALREKARQQAIRWLDRYAIRDIAPRHQQLCIDVTTVERARIAELFPDAELVMTICRGLGGRTKTSVPLGNVDRA